MLRHEKAVRRVGWVLCELFVLATIAILLYERRYDRLTMAGATVLSLAAPWILERWLGCRLAWPVYLFCLLYALGPMVGQCYDLYYKVGWWDRLLHVCGGAVFAVLGSLLFERFTSRERRGAVMTAVFALCFSMTVLVLWEFGEFGADTLLGTDAQDDTVITELHSYLLGPAPGVTGTIRDVRAVTVNGERLPVAGYIDVGLIDTMWDMLLGALGAAAVSLLRLCGFHKWAVWKKK